MNCACTSILFGADCAHNHQPGKLSSQYLLNKSCLKNIVELVRYSFQHKLFSGYASAINRY